MITCKEDLKGFYALRSDKEVFELFMDKCEEFGIKWSDGNLPRGVKVGEAVSVAFSDTSYDRLSFGSELSYKNLGRKAITLADFKVVSKKLGNDKGIASKWKYVPIDMIPAEVYGEMLTGEVFHSEGEDLFWCGTSFWKGKDRLTYIDNTEKICRKVEVNWQDEVASLTGFKVAQGNICTSRWITSEDFLEAARIALKVLGELKC